MRGLREIMSPKPRTKGTRRIRGPPVRGQPSRGGEEQALLNQIAALPFEEFQFHGFLGKRRVVSFGWRYDFNGGGLSKTDDMPAFLLAVRQKAASFGGVLPSNLQQVLVTEYCPGAAIGWHKDRSVIGNVVGI